jgi:phage gpG-like protein
MLNAFESEVNGDTVSITQPKSYGRELQEGRSDMPARPFLGFTDNDAKVLIQLFLQEVRR